MIAATPPYAAVIRCRFEAMPARHVITPDASMLPLLPPAANATPRSSAC